MKPKHIFIIGLMTASIGMMVFLPSSYYWYRDRQIVKAAKEFENEPAIDYEAVTAKPNTLSGRPDRLIISNLAMDLPVIDGRYDTSTGEWSLSLDKAHYALNTMLPNNEKGNTLIYGHYRPEVFARLHTIKPATDVKIVTDNGLVFEYKYIGSEVVSPTDTRVFNYEGAPRLTIQTCTGAFMQDRQLFYFEFVGTRK